ncbi:MAG: hypothetical protein AAF039_17120 [Bacteroidota bacterium]
MDKLEKHIKDKLRNREISPSPQAWGKIVEELGAEKGASPKKTYWWAIAAGIIGFILLSIGFFNPADALKDDKGTVVAKEETKTMETLEIDAEHDNNLESPQEVVIIEVPLDKGRELETKNNDDSIQVVENEVSHEKEPLKDVQGVTDLAINDKLEKILAQVNSMEHNSIVVSDKEIDSLLMAAQRELLTEKTLEKNGKVDAMALLNEVELELYDDQRNPLFIKLKEGFFMLRTAVADRDN